MESILRYTFHFNINHRRLVMSRINREIFYVIDGEIKVYKRTSWHEFKKYICYVIDQRVKHQKRYDDIQYKCLTNSIYNKI